MRYVVTLLLLLVIPPSLSFAQQDASARAAALAQGWSLLAKGDSAGAAKLAWQELSRNVHDQSALALVIEATVARAGGKSGLATYEQWLGSRRLDNAYVLRLVSRAMLVESQKSANITAKLAALEALAADGDAAAVAQLEQASSSDAFGETRVLASIGNEQAVKRLLTQLAALPSGRGSVIEALGDSGSKLAVPALKALLSAPNDIERASAVAALGRLGAIDALPQMRPLLNDQVFTVKLKAAGALLRLNDMSGMSLLNELSTSEHAGIRIAAATELASRPDGVWQDMVRNLANDPDPTVRMQVARLIAPYDQALANRILDGLMRDDNVAVREGASGVLIEHLASDFATLRALMRSGDEVTRVKAAARILELTR